MILDMGTPAEIPTDGRVQRSERSREAIVQAMLDLIGEGTLSPTAQQVAERADVGVRTVFRHFSDMDTLFATMNERLTESVSDLFVNIVQEGPLDERIDALMDRRFQIFGKLGPYYQSGAQARARSPFLREQHDVNCRTFRRDLRLWIPEIKQADTPIASALELTLSHEAYNQLRVDHKLTAKKASETIRTIVIALAVSLPRPIDGP